MRRATLASLAFATALLGGCSTYGDNYGGGPARYGDYDYNRPDPRYNGYYADRYYRGGGNYQQRRLSDNDRVYRGRNGKYYCRRDDGTTGLIVGGVAGGVLGNIIAPGGSELLGTLLGAAGGALAGRAIDRNDNNGVTCR